MPTALVFLIENTRAKRASFSDSLKKRYEVLSVTSGRQAMTLAAERTPSLIILDAISLRTPGDRIVRTLKDALPHVPVIQVFGSDKDDAATELTPARAARARQSRNGVHDKARERENASGADLALCSPTSRKLIFAIERLLNVQSVSPSSDENVQCGPFTVHLGRSVLIFNGQETPLTPKSALLMQVFLRSPGQTLSRKVLMERVWQTEYLGDTRTLDVHIRWIRQTIEANPSKPRYLQTVRGVGYRFDIPEVRAPFEGDAARVAVAAPLAAENEALPV